MENCDFCQHNANDIRECLSRIHKLTATDYKTILTGSSQKSRILALLACCTTYGSTHYKILVDQ